MAISRVSDAQTFGLINSRVGELQARLAQLRDQVATGRRFTTPDEDPLGASSVVRLRSSLAALDQYSQSAKFGDDVLTAQFSALREAKHILDRAEEIAVQQSASFRTPQDRVAAAEEVHGLLQALTTTGNSSFGGRRLFAWLAQDSAAPFTDPDAPGYDPQTAYTAVSSDFSVKIGSSASERVRITSRGDGIFVAGLQGLKDLETALRSNGNIPGTIAGLKTAQDVVAAEQASIGSRQGALKGRVTQITALTGQERGALARTTDADLFQSISELTQTQAALQALLGASSQLAQQSLSSLLRF
jgi:flagellar hook-associated protein 3 FlgL